MILTATDLKCDSAQLGPKLSSSRREEVCDGPGRVGGGLKMAKGLWSGPWPTEATILRPERGVKRLIQTPPRYALYE